MLVFKSSQQTYFSFHHQIILLPRQCSKTNRVSVLDSKTFSKKDTLHQCHISLHAHYARVANFLQYYTIIVYENWNIILCFLAKNKIMTFLIHSTLEGGEWRSLDSVIFSVLDVSKCKSVPNINIHYICMHYACMYIYVRINARYRSQFLTDFHEINMVGMRPHMGEHYCFWKQSHVPQNQYCRFK